MTAHNYFSFCFLTLVLFISCVHHTIDNTPPAEVAAPEEPGSVREAEVATSSTDDFAALVEPARKVLITTCGKCHQSTLPTHKAGAIAIFDLDQGENWHLTLTEESASGIKRRMEKSADISEEERAELLRFLELKAAALQEAG